MAPGKPWEGPNAIIGSPPNPGAAHDEGGRTVDNLLGLGGITAPFQKVILGMAEPLLAIPGKILGGVDGVAVGVLGDVIANPFFGRDPSNPGVPVKAESKSTQTLTKMSTSTLTKPAAQPSVQPYSPWMN